MPNYGTVLALFGYFLDTLWFKMKTLALATSALRMFDLGAGFARRSCLRFQGAIRKDRDQHARNVIRPEVMPASSGNRIRTVHRVLAAAAALFVLGAAPQVNAAKYEADVVFVARSQNAFAASNTFSARGQFDLRTPFDIDAYRQSFGPLAVGVSAKGSVGIGVDAYLTGGTFDLALPVRQKFDYPDDYAAVAGRSFFLTPTSRLADATDTKFTVAALQPAKDPKGDLLDVYKTFFGSSPANVKPSVNFDLGGVDVAVSALLNLGPSVFAEACAGPLCKRINADLPKFVNARIPFFTQNNLGSKLDDGIARDLGSGIGPVPPIPLAGPAVPNATRSYGGSVPLFNLGFDVGDSLDKVLRARGLPLLGGSVDPFSYQLLDGHLGFAASLSAQFDITTKTRVALLFNQPVQVFEHGAWQSPGYTSIFDPANPLQLRTAANVSELRVKPSYLLDADIYSAVSLAFAGQSSFAGPEVRAELLGFEGTTSPLFNLKLNADGFVAPVVDSSFKANVIPIDTPAFRILLEDPRTRLLREASSLTMTVARAGDVAANGHGFGNLRNGTHGDAGYFDVTVAGTFRQISSFGCVLADAGACPPDELFEADEPVVISGVEIGTLFCVTCRGRVTDFTFSPRVDTDGDGSLYLSNLALGIDTEVGRPCFSCDEGLSLEQLRLQAGHFTDARITDVPEPGVLWLLGPAVVLALRRRPRC